MVLINNLKIGFIQTVIDSDLAWLEPAPSLNMKSVAERKVWGDVRKGFYNLKDYLDHPDIVVLPELTVPHGYLDELKILSKALGSVVIGGLDFEKVGTDRVRNKAVVIVPQNWPNQIKSRRVSSFYFGKNFFSEAENEFFNNWGYKPFPDPVTYMFDGGVFGKIGLAICSDFYDIERFVTYRGQIHHMIVVSRNQDTNSFYFLAEAIARLVYCNVVICNAGCYGDSLAFSPYEAPYRRIVYRHEGQNLFTTQVVTLPVLELDNAQRKSDRNKLFKLPPPGYKKK